MSLAGKGVVAIWNDIAPEARADFFEWHNREHMPERVAIPGFRRGQRFVAVDAGPEFFTLYETDSPQVLSGPDYLARAKRGCSRPSAMPRCPTRCSPRRARRARSLSATVQPIQNRDDHWMNDANESWIQPMDATH